MGATEKLYQTDELSFVCYDPNDIRQHIFLREIAQDEEISRYINDIARDVKNSVRLESNIIGYLIKDNVSDSYIGVLTVKSSGYDLTAAPVEYAVHKNYRNLGKRYGSRILCGIRDLLFQDSSISRMVLEIKRDNIASINAAKNALFDIDYELTEQFIYEGYNYVPFSSYNRFYTSEHNIHKVKVK